MRQFQRKSALVSAFAILAACQSALATLPPEYVELEYLASSGTQYVDTGVYPKSTTRIVVDFRYPAIPTANAFCGWGSSGHAETFLFGANQNAFYAYVSGNWRSSPTGIATDTARHVFDLANGALYLDGVLFSTTNTLGNTALSSQTMYLFASRIEWNPKIDYYCSMEIYSCRIYDGSSIVRDFVPARRVSDSALGLYDLRNNTFYPNKGTGAFTAGADSTPLHRYVVPAGTAGNTPAEPYDSWATAANSLAVAYAALPPSGKSAVIHIAPGEYEQTAALTVSRGNVEFRSDDGDGNLARKTTILDGGFRSVADNDRTNGIFRVSAHGVAIRGLTLQNACSPTSGGGVRVASAARSLTIDSCTLSNCQARLLSGNANSFGGGVFFEGDVAGLGHLITNTLFHSCSSANYGGSIRVAKLRSAYGSRSDYLLVQDCEFVKSSVNKNGDPTSGYGSQMGGTISGPVWAERSRFDGASCSGSTCRGSFLHEGKYSIFDGCIFENSENVSLFAGGNCIISNSVIRGNKGIFSFGDYGITLVGCVFTNQPTLGGYSGMGSANVNLTMRNCLYAYNDQPLVLQGCTLENCTVVSNNHNGIALSVGRDSTIRIRNCVVFGNKYQSYAGNVNGPTATGDFFYTKDWAKRPGVSLIITNSYFEKGATVSLDNYQGAGAAVPLFSLDGTMATSNITAAANAAKDKLFVDWPHRNWRLTRKSPLREAGVRYSWMNAPATDLDGNPRLTDAFGKAFASSALPDLGCYECQAQTPRNTTILLQ